MREDTELCFTPRGILKSFIVMVLSEKPLHGYAIIQKIEKHTGFWKPSPGSIYPMLSLMEREGILRKRRDGTKYVYSLSSAGKKMASKAQEIKGILREKSLRTLSSIVTSGDFARMNEGLVNKVFMGKPSYGSVRAANSIWVSTMRYFYTRQDTRLENVERLLKKADSDLRKLLDQ